MKLEGSLAVSAVWSAGVLGVLFGLGLASWRGAAEGAAAVGERVVHVGARAQAGTAEAGSTAAMREDAMGGQAAPGQGQVHVPEGGRAAWMKAWAGLKRAQERQRFLTAVLATHGRRSMDEVIAFLSALPPSQLRNASMEQALLMVGESAPERALELVEEHLPGMDGANCAAALLEQWGALRPRDALRWAVKQSPVSRALDCVETVVAAAAQVDPLQTRDLVLGGVGLDPQQRALALKALAGVWAQNDPVAALAWAKAQHGNAGGEDIVSVAYLNWAGNDPAGAAQALLKEDAALAPAIAGELAGLWVRNDPAAAAAWLSGLPEVRAREEALQQVAGVWAQSDPQAALHWALQLDSSEAGRAGALQAAALQWIRFKPGALERYLQLLPEGQRGEIQGLVAKAAGKEEGGGRGEALGKAGR